MDERLQKVISSAKVQERVGELLRLALEAHGQLQRLDESLYERFVASRSSTADPARTEAELRTLWERTFAGIPALLAYCATLTIQKPAPEDEPSGPNFDFFEDAPPSPKPDFDLPANEIGDLLEGITVTSSNDTEKWAHIVEILSSIEFGLRSQFTEANARFDTAIGSGDQRQVLELLDDTHSSISEAVHAIITGVYSEFLPELNAASIVPGYHTSLGRALMVRRGIAELQTSLEPLNGLLQANTIAADFALRNIRDTMHEFVGSLVCRAMRAADRWQMTEFDRELAEQSLVLARQTSEGLVKYLESLRSVSQREVLVIHDRRVFDEMRESISTGRQLLDLSAQTAFEYLDRARHAALRLRGRRLDTDALLLHLDDNSHDPSTALQLVERLEAILATA